MADTKISALSSGTAASADQIPINRAGTNYRINAGDIAGIYEVATFANLPAAASVTVGRVYTVLGAIVTGGQYGTRWVSDGAVWRPACVQMIYATSTQVDGTAASTSEQILRQLLLPAGLLSGCNRIQIWSKYVTNGTSDPNARTARIRLGTAGTIADTALFTASIVNTSRQAFVHSPMGYVSDTALAYLGFAITQSTAGFFSSSASTSANPSNATVSSMSGALYLSMTSQQGASPVDTVGLARFFLEVA